MRVVTERSYRGNVLEYGSSDRILTNPIHPYTELLFANRCAFVQPVCRLNKPPLVQIPGGARGVML